MSRIRTHVSPPVANRSPPEWEQVTVTFGIRSSGPHRGGAL